jgi:hypothetical protein
MGWKEEIESEAVYLLSVDHDRAISMSQAISLKRIADVLDRLVTLAESEE